MRKLLMLGAVLAAVAFPTASHAQFTLGLRVGYGVAMGDVAGNGAGSSLAMSDWVKSQVPVQVDAMYRFTPEWAAGVYFSYGFGQLSSTISDLCSAYGKSCSASNTRFGVQGAYTFTTVSPSFVPWAGLGIGYEWNTVDEAGTKGTFKGWEYLNLQLGGDYKVNPKFAVGPYVLFAIGQYGEGEIAGVSGSVTEKTTHEWLSFGVRGKFDL